MKLSLLTTSLILTGSLYASNGHQISETQEGVHAVKLFHTTLQTNLKQKLQVDHNGTSAMEVCTTEADKTMKEINNQLEAHVKIRITSLELNNTSNPTDLIIMKKYQADIKKKTAGAMIITTAKVKGTTRIYKPLVIDNVWLECHDDKSTVKIGDFKGVIVSEVSKH